MANKNLTEVVFIIDRSGSMQTMKADVIGGFNAFIDNQRKQSGEAKVSVALFDNEYSLLVDGKDIQDVDYLNETTYVPRGGTALLDAIGRTINDVQARIKKASAKERPSKVIAVVITDGEENGSREFRKDTITEMLKEQREKNKWEVLFIGADEASIRGAGNVGLGSTLSGRSAVYTMGSPNPHDFSRGIRGASTIGASAIASGTLRVDGVDTFAFNGTPKNAMMDAYSAITMAVSNYRATGDVGDWVNGEDLTKKDNA